MAPEKYPGSDPDLREVNCPMGTASQAPVDGSEGPVDGMTDRHAPKGGRTFRRALSLINFDTG